MCSLCDEFVGPAPVLAAGARVRYKDNAAIFGDVEIRGLVRKVDGEGPAAAVTVAWANGLVLDTVACALERIGEEE